jgi:nickel-dependent lactate racemase
MLASIGDKTAAFSDDLLTRTSAQALEKIELENKRVLVIIPDSTRTAPVGLFFRIFAELLLPKVRKLDFLIALGTHRPMQEDAVNALLGITAAERNGKFRDITVNNHRWDKPETLTVAGTIAADEIEEISGGLMKQNVDITINKMVFDYDHIVIFGPVFPHEVVGFSGGNKYLFPGIAGADIIHLFHWLGALITNPVINGTKDTPVRAVINKAASFVDIPMTAFCLVMAYSNVCGLHIGSPIEAWSAAADLSAKVNIVYKEHPYKKVLAMAPEMYDDIWTAGKCMYKLEPVLDRGAELIILAPHIDEVSYTHGRIIDKIGYHTRDYFLKQMGRFRDIPGGVMAHSTHVKGIGTFEDGVERPRVNVVLATKIPPARCKQINLGYMNPDDIDPQDFADREGEGVLLVKKAGEMLYRLADGSVPRIDDLYKKQ